MEIVSSPEEISEILCKAIKKYKNVSFAVAWASANTKVYQLLIQKENKKKIFNSVVGLHFYQTHPDFLESFILHKEVKFVKNQKGVFHPKIYLFWNSNTDWLSIIGSANLTYSAMNENDETVVLLDSCESNMFNSIQEAILKYSSKDDSFTKEDLPQYRNVWEQRNKQKRI